MSSKNSNRLQAVILALLSSVYLGTTSVDAQTPQDTASTGGETYVKLDQGWSEATRNWWYTVTQGSRLLPLDWMLALELSDSEELFLSDTHIQQLGYLPNPKSAQNPYGLPVGFVIDQDSSRSADIMCETFPETCLSQTTRKPWVGMNCAACHTNDIVYDDRKFRVEGAPTLADFQTFEEEILNSLKATRNNPQKFTRFAQKVLESDTGDEKLESLKAQLSEQIEWQEKLWNRNNGSIKSGYGRLDAQGHILNKVSLITRVENQISDLKSDAPASYPFIWNASQQEKIQWNGIAKNVVPFEWLGLNTDFGALFRNTSEVIGVYAQIETDSRKAWYGYSSSVRLRNLLRLERELATLKSPAWPEDILPPIDPAKAEKGKQHYNRLCANCHQPLARDDLNSPARDMMKGIQEVRTDIFLACNTYLHNSYSGNQAGQLTMAFKGERLKERDYTRKMLINASVGAVVWQVDDLAKEIIEDATPPIGDPEVEFETTGLEILPGVPRGAKTDNAKRCWEQDEEILAYKARPLNGIWATAPYLHNGSVPTLYDLLLPAKIRLVRDLDIPSEEISGKTRPEIFSVGSREFDPKKVGFVSKVNEGDENFVFRVRDRNTSIPIPGNYNSGHVYGTQLSDEERYELVEYLKTL